MWWVLNKLCFPCPDQFCWPCYSSSLITHEMYRHVCALILGEICALSAPIAVSKCMWKCALRNFSFWFNYNFFMGAFPVCVHKVTVKWMFRNKLIFLPFWTQPVADPAVRNLSSWELRAETVLRGCHNLSRALTPPRTGKSGRHTGMLDCHSLSSAQGGELGREQPCEAQQGKVSSLVPEE